VPLLLQSALQHWVLAVQLAPVGTQPDEEQTPPTQLIPAQQSALLAHGELTGPQLATQVRLAASHWPEQHCALVVQVAAVGKQAGSSSKSTPTPALPLRRMVSVTVAATLGTICAVTASAIQVGEGLAATLAQAALYALPLKATIPVGKPVISNWVL
jgi:hypothetical protein